MVKKVLTLRHKMQRQVYTNITNTQEKWQRFAKAFSHDRRGNEQRGLVLRSRHFFCVFVMFIFASYDVSTFIIYRDHVLVQCENDGLENSGIYRRIRECAKEQKRQSKRKTHRRIYEHNSQK